MTVGIKDFFRRLYRGTAYKIKKWNYKRRESNWRGKYRFSQVTYYAVGNAGDTALSQCVRREFSNNIYKLGWNLIPVNAPVTEQIIKDINKTQALIIGGGGLFLPDTNANDISGWQWSVSKEQLECITVPVIVYSVGYNYFPGQLPTDLFCENLISLCKKADFIGLRNHGSVEAIKKLLPDYLSQKVIYQPCTTTVIRKIYGNKLPVKKNTGKIAINIAFDRAERRFGNYLEQICREIAQASKELENRGYEIYVVAHCREDSRIMQYMNVCNVNVKFVDLSRSFPMDVYRFYNKIDCVIGMRGHAQMIPFGLNCEILSLGTHDKMKWFLEDINATDWYIDLIENREHLKDTILEKFCTIHEIKHDETQRRLLDAQENLWRITQENMNEILRIIS